RPLTIALNELICLIDYLSIAAFGTVKNVVQQAFVFVPVGQGGLQHVCDFSHQWRFLLRVLPHRYLATDRFFLLAAHSQKHVHNNRASLWIDSTCTSSVFRANDYIHAHFPANRLHPASSPGTTALHA